MAAKKKRVRKLPNRSAAEKQVKGLQVAFNVEEHVVNAIRLAAYSEGLSPSDKVRQIIGLPYKAPIRPRLTTTLKPEDRVILAKRYGLSETDEIEIHKRMVDEIVSFAYDEDPG